MTYSAFKYPLQRPYALLPADYLFGMSIFCIFLNNYFVLWKPLLLTSLIKMSHLCSVTELPLSTLKLWAHFPSYTHHPPTDALLQLGHPFPVKAPALPTPRPGFVPPTPMKLPVKVIHELVLSNPLICLSYSYSTFQKQLKQWRTPSFLKHFSRLRGQQHFI